MSTLPTVADRPSSNPKNPLRPYVRLSTKHPVRSIPSFPVTFPSSIERAKHPPRSIARLRRGSSPSAHPQIGCPSGIPRGMARVQVVIHRLVERSEFSFSVADTFLGTVESRRLMGDCWGFQDDQSGYPARASVVGVSQQSRFEKEKITAYTLLLFHWLKIYRFYS